MSITFQCEHCRREVEAPDEAAGRRGKCPFCGQSNYIPMPAGDKDMLPLAPVDEQEERRRQEELQRLFQQERELDSEICSAPAAPLEHREDLKSDDLHHFVVNYCLDLARGNLGRGDTYIQQLRRFGPHGLQAVDDFLSGKALEPALDAIPTKTLQGFLRQLRERVSA
ncbi:MAG TPA: hypothetical protein VM098_08785 [Phycisphaerae bacterium]|nr:hypothetical protein [Phycisphaerae bacterium]